MAMAVCCSKSLQLRGLESVEQAFASKLAEAAPYGRSASVSSEHRIAISPRALYSGQSNLSSKGLSLSTIYRRGVVRWHAAALQVDGDAKNENAEEPKKVVITTTPNSRSVSAFLDEEEPISDRYVRGSLTFQVELSKSICLDDPTVGTASGAFYKEEEDSRIAPRETEEASTSGNSEEPPWRSETYLKHTLQKRRRSQKVVLQFSDGLPPVPELPSRSQRSEDFGTSPDDTERVSVTEEEEIARAEELKLRRALSEKRKIAKEIFESLLKTTGLLGPMFVRDLLSCSPQFIDRIVTEAVALKQQERNRELSFHSRARLYLSNVKVVQLIKWLKQQKLTGPRIGRLISIADESLGLVKPRIEWLRNIYVRGRDLGLILERYPQVLASPLEDLDRKMAILETAGVQRMWLGFVVSRQPRILTLRDEELLEKVTMISELGISKDKFGVMVYKFPAVVGHFSVEEMRSKVDYLQQIGIDDTVLARILVSTPQLLACSIEQSWAKLLRYFYFLRIELRGVRRILGVNPSIFCLNLEENIAPKVAFLRAIGVHEEAIGQLIVDFPTILTYSLDRKIRPLVRFLLEEAGVPEEKVGKVVTMEPELIRCSLPNKLQVLVKYLRSRRIRVPELGHMISDFPALLMYSVPNLHPKLQYLAKVMKRPVADLVAFPRYVSYSLKLRVIPRHEILAKNGLTFGLRQMLACSDDGFEARVELAKAADLKQSNFGEESNRDVENTQLILSVE